jgi:aspartyl-tRNA(Asn)/glutamyl-tRNA(Gln) amidotransferase subunit C
MLIYPDLPLSLMSINKDTIKKISKLARISVTNEETDRLEKDLNSIIKFVEQLKELNTDKITPIASVSDQALTMNKDEIKKINEKEEILKNAPEKNSNYYIVPKVIE